VKAFDEPASIRINAARGEFMERTLDELQNLGLRTAADIACGFGHFSGILDARGLKVTAVDGRAENIEETRRRVPSVATAVHDVEAPSLHDIGTFDFVLCYGLLYHLENPFAAVRNLGAVTGHALLVESVVVPGDETSTALYEEDHDVDQGLNYYAMIPTENWLVKALYISGFNHVYRSKRSPAHEDFRPSVGKRRRRTVLLATRAPVSIDTWARATEPIIRKYLWDALGPIFESERVRGVVRTGLRATRRGG
jgi:SAM-dependent methyltransferase